MRPRFRPPRTAFCYGRASEPRRRGSVFTEEVAPSSDNPSARPALPACRTRHSRPPLSPRPPRSGKRVWAAESPVLGSTFGTRLSPSCPRPRAASGASANGDDSASASATWAPKLSAPTAPPPGSRAGVAIRPWSTCLSPRSGGRPAFTLREVNKGSSHSAPPLLTTPSPGRSVWPRPRRGAAVECPRPWSG